MTEPEDSDLLAAEYVLGTLDVADRVMAASRTETDVAFARMVADWQDRLAPLIETIDPIAPPGQLFDDLLVRLFGTQPMVDEVAMARLKRRVRWWQGSTAGLSAIAAALLAWIALGGTTSQRPDRFTACSSARRQCSGDGARCRCEVTTTDRDVSGLGVARREELSALDHQSCDRHPPLSWPDTGEGRDARFPLALRSGHHHRRDLRRDRRALGWFTHGSAERHPDF